MRHRFAKQITSLFLPAPVRANYADSADFLRVACVGLIGWYHIWQLSWLNPNLVIRGHIIRLWPIVSGGYLLVDLMLCLSGFLLMLGWLSGRNRDLRSFYAARAVRILPSYLFCIAIMLFVFALPGGLYSSSKHLWKDLLYHLSFTHNLFIESYGTTKLNGVLWTLAIEVQFYLIFPFLARLFARRPGWTYAVMLTIAFIFRGFTIFYVSDTFFYVNRLAAMLDVFANGMLAAFIYYRLQNTPLSIWRAWLATALTIASAVLIYKIMNKPVFTQDIAIRREGQLIWRFPLSALGCVFLLCGSRSIRLLRSLFSNRFIRFLSGISFNFYIWHQVVAQKLKDWHIPSSMSDMPHFDGEQPWQNRYTLLCFVSALLFSILITYAVEKPCARLIKSRLGRRKTLETKGSA